MGDVISDRGGLGQGAASPGTTWSPICSACRCRRTRAANGTGRGAIGNGHGNGHDNGELVDVLWNGSRQRQPQESWPPMAAGLGGVSGPIRSTAVRCTSSRKRIGACC
ncbi:hypothetical protein AAF143_07320 [Cyanobium sp. ATX-6F1]